MKKRISEMDVTELRAGLEKLDGDTLLKPFANAMQKRLGRLEAKAASKPDEVPQPEGPMLYGDPGRIFFDLPGRTAGPFRTVADAEVAFIAATTASK